MTIASLNGLSGLPASQWDALRADDQPFLAHGWLAALEQSGAVGRATGWQPHHLARREGEKLAAVAPAYLKTHSYGEYVFDWAWAEAYQRAGLAYYPKLLLAVPFTPVSGQRILGVPAGRAALVAELPRQVRELGLSSAHVLYPAPDDMALLAEAGWLERHGVQFHWRNRGYHDFDDYLDVLSRDKRKKIRQERRRVAEQGVEVVVKEGREICDDDWAFFHACYCRTYREHRSTPYLNLAFFRLIGERLAEHLVLFLAFREGRPVAASLCLKDGRQLYGRYWGALEEVSCLHFELCYYQGIAYCIRHGLAVFEGGAQGEHKLARGFEPVRTCSTHWLADSPFRSAIWRWLEQEKRAIAAYLGELERHIAYKKACQS
ncbi:GNAT family N-acetyltransferase [Pseudogulbenkiania sp. MAI-1]|uniref:GNAT family N-acetyltransferase n=1 Tax=Pseudogulbenkiania sp. MAI-1 TaxID=990370 RepID=UPI00045E79A9|nr:GNAT family N-acetyltransferase [Pseudogulbenkiania sp. MAI-1]